jgi:predicted Na+-dependent transporter
LPLNVSVASACCASIRSRTSPILSVILLLYWKDTFSFERVESMEGMERLAVCLALIGIYNAVDTRATRSGNKFAVANEHQSDCIIARCGPQNRGTGIQRSLD